ncbi:universal stress protein [Haloprofundus salilacus]|uniref:universal stress protein n=1 Tax=Haloprofundus salilacus TaxID=2876190 RepID=UPI001CCE1D64|nr:universal stress protein [Haloprofundus salilacus]
MPDGPRILVPLRVLEGESLATGLATFLAPASVVVLGYYVVPEQTPPGQARMEFEELGQSKLDEVTDLFADDVETRLVFTRGEAQTVDRVADELDCEAYLIANPAPTVERVLVPLHPDVDIDHVARVVAPLVAGRDVEVTLFRAVSEDTDSSAEAAAEDPLVADARATLLDGGVSSDRISAAVVATDDPISDTADVAADHDAVVMGERTPSLRSFVFGEESDRVADRSLGPVVVVRREKMERGETT